VRAADYTSHFGAVTVAVFHPGYLRKPVLHRGNLAKGLMMNIPALGPQRQIETVSFQSAPGNFAL